MKVRVGSAAEESKSQLGQYGPSCSLLSAIIDPRHDNQLCWRYREWLVRTVGWRDAREEKRGAECWRRHERWRD